MLAFVRRPAPAALPVPAALSAPREPADTLMTRDEVAAYLKVKPRQVERLGVPCLNLGVKTKRYLRSDVLAWLEAKRESA